MDYDEFKGHVITEATESLRNIKHSEFKRVPTLVILQSHKMPGLFVRPVPGDALTVSARGILFNKNVLDFLKEYEVSMAAMITTGMQFKYGEDSSGMTDEEIDELKEYIKSSMASTNGLPQSMVDKLTQTKGIETEHILHFTFFTDQTEELFVGKAIIVDEDLPVVIGDIEEQTIFNDMDGTTILSPFGQTLRDYFYEKGEDDGH